MNQGRLLSLRGSCALEACSVLELQRSPLLLVFRGFREKMEERRYLSDRFSIKFPVPFIGSQLARTAIYQKQ
jgi:hypothetical protein